MRFLTPEEDRLLSSLPGDERAVLQAFFEHTDARLVDAPFDHVYMWGNNEARVPLKGRRCRVLIWGGAMNTLLVEFEDGAKVTTSRNAVRKVTGEEGVEKAPLNVGAFVPDQAGSTGQRHSGSSSAVTSHPSLFPMRKEANRD